MQLRAERRRVVLARLVEGRQDVLHVHLQERATQGRLQRSRHHRRREWLVTGRGTRTHTNARARAQLTDTRTFKLILINLPICMCLCLYAIPSPFDAAQRQRLRPRNGRPRRRRRAKCRPSEGVQNSAEGAQSDGSLASVARESRCGAAWRARQLNVLALRAGFAAALCMQGKVCALHDVFCSAVGPACTCHGWTLTGRKERNIWRGGSCSA